MSEEGGGGVMTSHDCGLLRRTPAIPAVVAVGTKAGRMRERVSSSLAPVWLPVVGDQSEAGAALRIAVTMPSPLTGEIVCGPCS